jgi:hypothetical protein
MSHERLNDLARTIIDSNPYIVLGTADQVRPPSEMTLGRSGCPPFAEFPGPPSS